MVRKKIEMLKKFDKHSKMNEHDPEKKKSKKPKYQNNRIDEKRLKNALSRNDVSDFDNYDEDD